MKKILLLLMGMVSFISMNAETKYPVNLNVGSNGSASVDRSEAAVGETVTITLSPDQWYEVDTVTVDVKYEPNGSGGGALAPRRIKIAQGSVAVTRVDATTYQFTLPEKLEDVFNLYTETTEFEVNVTFKEKPTYTVRLIQPTGGSLSFYEPYVTGNELQAYVGQEIIFSADNLRGYVFESVKVVVGGTENELSLTRVENPYFNRYSFVLPETLPGTSSEYQDDTYFEITAVFPARKFDITILPNENGTVVAEPDYATAHMTTYFNVTPEGGYKIDNLLIKYVDEAGNKTNVSNDDWGYGQTKVNNFQYSLLLKQDPGYYYSATFHLDHFEVTPYYSLIDYNVNVQSAEHGTVSSDKVTGVHLGDVVTLTIEADEGYKLESLVVKVGDSENELPLTEVDATHYTFTLTGEPLKDIDTNELNVIPVFTEREFNIVIEETAHGTVLSDKSQAIVGDNVYLTLTPAPGYKLDPSAITITASYDDGEGHVVSQGTVSIDTDADDNIFFTLPATVTGGYKENTEFHVSVNYVQLHYNINVFEYEHGTATTNPENSVTYGETVTINCSPDSGYEADTDFLKVIPHNGTSDYYDVIVPSMVDRNTFTFVVTGEEYVEGTQFDVYVSFRVKPVRYDIVVEPTEHGTVTTDVSDLAIAETATITLEPSQGYELDTLIVEAGYEVTGGSENPRAPRRAPGAWNRQDYITVTKIDDTHYSFTAPEGFSSVVTPNYLENTEFRVKATFKPSLIELENAADNTSVLEEVMGATTDVSLKGRTLSGNGVWNTLCLPFDVVDGDDSDGISFTGTPLEGAVVKRLTASAYDQESNTLSLTFSEVTGIEAGTSYIVKWETAGGVSEPLFENVTISKLAPIVEEVGCVTVNGTFAPVVIEDEDHGKLFFGSDNKLYYPSGVRPTNINSQRCYYQLSSELHAEEPIDSGSEQSGETKFRVYVVSDGDMTGIESLTGSDINDMSGAWYDLSGRRLNGRPQTPGLYIKNGKKYMLK